MLRVGVKRKPCFVVCLLPSMPSCFLRNLGTSLLFGIPIDGVTVILKKLERQKLNVLFKA